MKKVLIITYYWPPSGGSGVQRWLKFTKYLREFGWEPIIYTPELKQHNLIDSSLDKDIPENLTVIKKPIWEPYGIYNKITGNKEAQSVSFLSEKKPGFFQKLSQWVRGNFFIPDPRVFWVKPSIKFLSNYLETNAIDAVVTTGPPHSMHLIGLGLKKKTGIKWLADFRDPWTNIDYYNDLYLTGFADRKHKKLEKKVLQKADEVVAVGDTLASELKSLGNRDVSIITNGYDPQDYLEMNQIKPKSFSFAHVGLLSGPRSHTALWNSFANFLEKYPSSSEELKIKLIGKTDYKAIKDITKAGIGQYVEKLNYVSHSEVSSIQMESYVVLLLVNNAPNSKGIVLGKTFEYLASGRPILGIGDINGDAAIILEETKSGEMFDYEDEEGITRYIETKYKEFKSGNLQAVSGAIEKYSRRELAHRLSERLNFITR